MTAPNRTPKPSFRPAETWGACSRCNARVRYSTLRRERLTGLLVCSEASGRPVNPCWDPWPAVYDFQAFPDKSIEPPPEPLPLRYNLDAIWGNGPERGTTSVFANAPAPAPDDATRLANLLSSVPYYANMGKSAAFMGPNAPLAAKVYNLTTIVPANYDGTFIPSGSVRTVVPPDEATELANVLKTDKDLPDDSLWSPPWSQVKGVLNVIALKIAAAVLALAVLGAVVALNCTALFLYATMATK